MNPAGPVKTGPMAALPGKHGLLSVKEWTMAVPPGKRSTMNKDRIPLAQLITSYDVDGGTTWN